MHFFSKADPYRHQIILSLRSDAVVVMHFVRSLRGWTRAHEGRADLIDPLSDGDALRGALERLLQPWGLPAATPARWVLPPDILGVLTQHGAQSTALRLPFEAAEVQQAVITRKTWTGNTLLWLHKDWLQLLDGLCRTLGLVLVEVFARAQLHRRDPRDVAPPLRCVVERDGAAVLLHVYSPMGQILRSSQLAAGDATALAGRLQAEILSLASAMAMTQRPVARIVYQGQAVPMGEGPPSWVESVAGEPIPEHTLLEGTLDTEDDGIAVRPAENRWTQHIRQTSLAFGALGLAGLGLMSWHDGQLEARQDADQKWLKKQSVRYENLRVLQKNALLGAQAGSGAAQLATDGVTSAALAAFIAVLPAQAVITGFDLGKGTLQVNGTGATTAAMLEVLGKAEGFSGLRELPPAPGADGKAFALELRYQTVAPGKEAK